MKKLKVLILAEAANPELTSVPLIGWSFSNALSKYHDVHLLTQVRNKQAIENYGWTEGKEFTSIDTEKIASPAYKFALFLRGGNKVAWTITTAINSITYPYFEYLCWKKFKHKLINGEYDVVHRITPVSPTTPSFIAKKLKKINIPFIVGPINGGVEWPKEYDNLRKKEKEWLVKFKSLARFIPGRRSVIRDSSAIVCGSKATQKQLPEKSEPKQFYIPENAISVDRFNQVSTSNFNLPVKSIFIGRLVPYKGADMAIDAITELAQQGKMTFDIYGSGPEEALIESIIKERNLEGKVTLKGFVPNDELQAELLSADLLVFPSIREFGGGVVLEAMSLGIVPVIVDYAGPAELVDKKTGYKVPISKRDQLVSDLRTLLNQIIETPSELKAKRQHCINKVRETYTWEAKVSQISAVYNWAIEGGSKPNIDL